MSKKMLKPLALFQAVCMICVLLLTGCGSGTGSENAENQSTSQAPADTQSTTAAQAQKEGEPYEFSVFRATWTELNDSTDLIIQELNKKLNTKIKIVTSPYETYVDKYNVLMASDQTPDLSCIPGPGYYNYDQWVEQGKYLELTDLYPQYPNIVKWVPQGSIDPIKIKGRVYCIPKPYVYEDAMVFRADWLKNLNLSIPANLDELYNVLKAFTENDPDKDGQKNTVGLTSDDSTYNFMYIFGAFGVYGSPLDGYAFYKTPEGKIDSTLMMPGAKDAVKFLAQLYKEKLLDQEWMLTKSQGVQDKFSAGKTGCITTGISVMYNLEANMQKVDPNISLEATTKIADKDGNYRKDIMSSYYMTNSISSKAQKPEKILEFLDYLLTDEGVDLLSYGIEGLTYARLDNGNIVVDQGAATKYGLVGGHKFTWMMSRADWSFPKDDRGNKYREMCKWFLEQQPALAPAIVTAPSKNDVAAKQGADMIQKQITAMICGKTDIDNSWDAMIKQWKETGGDQVLKEVNDNFARANAQ